MAMFTCQWCGKKFDPTTAGHRSNTGYCSEKCVVAARAAGKGSSRGASFAGAISGASSRASAGGLRLAIPIIVILVVIGLIGMAVNGIKNAVSDTKIKIVSASCETQERFVEIATEALSGVSGTLLEGEEFTTYSQKARDAVKKRKGEHGLYKDAVYSVRLPDKVNAYVWFESENKVRAIVYKTE